MNRGAKSIKTYVLIDAKEKNSNTKIDGACFKGEHYKYYFGVGMDAPGAEGIKNGKYKQNIYEGGTRKKNQARKQEKEPKEIEEREEQER